MGVIKFIVGLGSGLTGGLFGLFLGAIYGGNYAPNFEFAGQRGSEVTGTIGLIAGFVLSSSAGVYLISRANRETGGCLFTLSGGIIGAVLVLLVMPSIWSGSNISTLIILALVTTAGALLFSIGFR